MRIVRNRTPWPDDRPLEPPGRGRPVDTVTSVSDRQALHVLLSPDAQQGLRTFAESNGISLSAMLEAIGALMADGQAADARVNEVAETIVARARGIDASRRTRSRTSNGVIAAPAAPAEW